MLGSTEGDAVEQGGMTVEANPSASGHSSVAFNILLYKYNLGSAVKRKDSAQRSDRSHETLNTEP